jgi:hypothetical protein
VWELVDEGILTSGSRRSKQRHEAGIGCSGPSARVSGH